MVEQDDTVPHPVQHFCATRRALVAAGAGLVAGAATPGSASAAQWPADLQAAIDTFARGATLREGKVLLEIAQLIDNGNAVPVRVALREPLGAGVRVTAMALFNERNPQRDMVSVAFGPLSGRPEFSTRVRLATSQKLVALARLDDGSCWLASADVVVTLAACIEGES